MIINSKMPNSPYSAIISKEEVYEQSTGLSTIITYIAIYIGLVFLITCAAVLALQQLSENADNIEKYKLLSKIGTSPKNDQSRDQSTDYLILLFAIKFGIGSFLCRN